MKTSLYIHIPFCKSKCTYCDFFSNACGEKPVPNDYVSALCHEIRIKKAEKNITAFNTIYIGGGTPSLLSREQFFSITTAVLENTTENPREFTVECNPDDVTNELLETFSKAGVTRISVGLQSFNQDSLIYVKRRSDSNKVIRALDIIKENWKGLFSADLIAGLPGETEKSFMDGLKILFKYNPDHISMYSLTLEEETPLGKSVFNNKIKYDFDLQDQIWLSSRDFLEENGYHQYEVSNFSKKNKECIHNLVYWKLYDYLGCGAGATGTFYGNKAVRFTNSIDLKKYVSYWNSETSSCKLAPGDCEVIFLETQKFEFFMMGLRTLKGISREEYNRRFLCDFSENFIKVFADWEMKGFSQVTLIENEHYYSLNRQGILFLNKFLEEIL